MLKNIIEFITIKIKFLVKYIILYITRLLYFDNRIERKIEFNINNHF